MGLELEESIQETYGLFELGIKRGIIVFLNLERTMVTTVISERKYYSRLKLFSINVANVTPGDKLVHVPVHVLGNAFSDCSYCCFYCFSVSSKISSFFLLF